MTSYEHWLQRTKQAIEQFRDRGMVVHVIEFDLNLFLAWCRAQKVEPNTQSRAAFAAVAGGEIDQRGKSDTAH